MAEVHLHYEIDGAEFSTAGEASGAMKKSLRLMGLPADVIRRCSICMYEGEINAVIHAGGGEADVYVRPEGVRIVISDHGPGIPDVEAAMQEGWSTASAEVRALGFGAGMGLLNMKRYSDEFVIDTQVGRGTTVTLDIRVGG